MQLSKDIEECIELFLSKGVEFLVVGGYALAAHGRRGSPKTLIF
jgi:hypothetical protein